MTDPLRARAVAAVRTFRDTGDRASLELLRQDGRRELAHDLTMERVLAVDPAEAAPYTARIEAWLAQ